MQTPIWAWRSLTHSKHLSLILWSIVNSFEWHCTPSYRYLYCTKSKQISYDMCMISCKTPFYRYNNNFFSDNFSISQMLSIWYTHFFYFWGKDLLCRYLLRMKKLWKSTINVKCENGGETVENPGLSLSTNFQFSRWDENSINVTRW